MSMLSNVWCTWVYRTIMTHRFSHYQVGQVWRGRWGRRKPLVQASRRHAIPSLFVRASKHASQWNDLPGHVGQQPGGHLRPRSRHHGQLQSASLRKEDLRQRCNSEKASTSGIYCSKCWRLNYATTCLIMSKSSDKFCTSLPNVKSRFPTNETFICLRGSD